MKTRKDVIDFCLNLEDTYEDYPFQDKNWTLMRHKRNRSEEHTSELQSRTT